MPDGATADPTDFYCSGPTGEGIASIEATCILPVAPVPPGCAPGYTQNGNICEYTGGLPGNQCLAGAIFNSTAQCCLSIPGSTDSYILCPVNAPYYMSGVCQPWPLADKVEDHTSVGLGSCDTGNPGGCQPPPNGCGIYVWNSQLCCCYVKSPTGGGQCATP